jgi:sugar phosphate isomerase/epimerase
MESYEGFYDGGISALSPESGVLTDYRMSAANLGFPGSPQSANQVQDVVNAIKHGTKTFEVTMLQPDVGESIPRQHFEEMKALMKLTGVKPSVHAPVIDAVGFGEQGWGKEEGRADNERRMFGAIEKAQALDPSGNLPIVFHATNGTPGAVWRPGDESKGEPERVLQSSGMINVETGQAQNVNRELKWRPSSFSKLDGYGEKNKDYGKEIEYDVAGSVDSANRADWESKLTEVAQMNKHAEELIGSAPLMLAEYQNAIVTKKGIVGFDEEGNQKWLPAIEKEEQVHSFNQLGKADLFLENAELSFKSAFGQAYTYGTEKQKAELEKLANKYTEKTQKTRGMVWGPVKKQRLLDEAIGSLRNITDDKKEKINGKEVIVGAPQVFKLSEDLALEKASETFGNLAARSYEKFEDKAPVLAIENTYPTQALSDAESLKNLIKGSRKNFVRYLTGERGMNKKVAEKLAKDKIGVTWDIGHLNMVKGKGFDDKEVLRQTKVMTKDKSMVKHIHLTDNFGYADTHLVPGMGNVPTKAIMEELEKTGRFDDMRKIVEAGGMVQHFKKLPHSMTLAAFGSGIYGMKNGPTWNQAIDMQGSYFGGYGTLNPQTHHSYFGAGFTTMPVELGGAMPGGQSRFGGAPMA